MVAKGELPMKIIDWRSKIDAIDTAMLHLLNLRTELALEVGRLKADEGVALRVPAREQEILSRMKSLNPGPLANDSVAKIYQVILANRSRRKSSTAMAERRTGREAGGRRVRTIVTRRGDRRDEMKVAKNARVAFQGERGAFSEEAAMKLLGEDIVLVPRPTFEAAFSAIDDAVADYILAPIENSLAGSVHRSFDLLVDSRLNILAEVIIPIAHNLIAAPGGSLEDLAIVESHPVALAQCEQFFSAHPRLKRIATEDTAGSVREVVRAGDRTRAAIAGRRAAEIYGGVILQEHLEDNRENYTRFLLLSPSSAEPENADKLSLVFQLDHRPGALYHALEPFARRNLNLMKIESRPVHGSPWQYRFYLDLQASRRDPEVAAALRELEKLVVELRILGSYVSAPRSDSGKSQPSART